MILQQSVTEFNKYYYPIMFQDDSISQVEITAPIIWPGRSSKALKAATKQSSM
jgi:hypothetical protein